MPLGFKPILSIGRAALSEHFAPPIPQLNRTIPFGIPRMKVVREAWNFIHKFCFHEADTMVGLIE